MIRASIDLRKIMSRRGGSPGQARSSRATTSGEIGCLKFESETHSGLLFQERLPKAAYALPQGEAERICDAGASDLNQRALLPVRRYVPSEPRFPRAPAAPYP